MAAPPGVGGASVASSSSVATSTVSTGGQGGTAGNGGGFSLEISLSPDSVLEAESHLAVYMDQAIAAAWIAVNPNGVPFIAYNMSFDGGDSWATPLPAPVDPGLASGDPVMAVNATGAFHLTYLGFDPFGMLEESVLYVTTAAPGSPTFGVATVVTQPQAFYDKPWMVVTPNGSIVVAYAEVGPMNYAFRIARSTDGGGSFTAFPIEMDTMGAMAWNRCYLCSSPQTGRVWVTYLQFDGFGVSVILRWSDDDGASWPPANRTTVSVEPNVGIEDPSCVASGSELWVSYGLSDDPVAMRSEFSQKLHAVRVAHSLNGGATIADRVDVHDSSAASFFMFPTLARNASGDLFIAYYSGDFEDDPNGAFRWSRAPAGSLAFEPSRVARSPIVFKQSRADPGWLGDYIGLSVPASRLHTVFPDNTSGFSHVIYHRADVP